MAGLDGQALAAFGARLCRRRRSIYHSSTVTDEGLPFAVIRPPRSRATMPRVWGRVGGALFHCGIAGTFPRSALTLPIWAVARTKIEVWTWSGCRRSPAWYFAHARRARGEL